MNGIFIPDVNKPAQCLSTDGSNRCCFSKPYFIRKANRNYKKQYICKLTNGVICDGKPERDCPLKEIKDTDYLTANTIRQMHGCKPQYANYVSVGGILNVLPSTSVCIEEVKKYGLNGWDKNGLDAEVLVRHFGNTHHMREHLNNDILERPVVLLDQKKCNYDNPAYRIIIFADSEDEEAENVKLDTI